MSGDELDLDAVENDARYTGARPSAAQALALVAEVRRLRAALDGRGVVLRDAYNDAVRTRDAMARRAYAAEAIVQRRQAEAQ